MLDPAKQHENERLLAPYRGFTPIELAQNLEVTISYVDIPEEPYFEGAIKKDANTNKVTIYVNKASAPNRQLFTIAHELGHFFLHKETLDQGIVSYRHAEHYKGYSKDQKLQEQDANNFAAELLMPEKIFREYYNQNSNLKIDELVKKMADFFGVSEDAIKVRMSYLDLLNY